MVITADIGGAFIVDRICYFLFGNIGLAQVWQMGDHIYIVNNLNYSEVEKQSTLDELFIEEIIQNGGAMCWTDSKKCMRLRTWRVCLWKIHIIYEDWLNVMDKYIYVLVKYKFVFVWF